MGRLFIAAIIITVSTFGKPLSPPWKPLLDTAREETVSVSTGREEQHAAGDNISNRQVILWDNPTNDHEAVLTESRTANRIANSRPQRILPTNSAGGNRTIGKLPIHAKYFQQKLLTFRGKERKDTSPFHVDVSCHYYVIALRRIIR